MSDASEADNFVGRRFLVTGAAGFTGHRVCQTLLEGGASVVALARRDPGLSDHSNLELIEADLCATPSLAGPFDAAVHCAATSPGDGVTDADILRDNVDGGRALLARLQEAGCTRLVFLSSLSVHGQITEPSVTSDTPVHHPDTYGRSKLAVEEMLCEGAAVMPAVAIRLPGIVGPGARRNWLTQVKAAALRGEEIVIFNPDASYNNVVHVDDLVAFITTLAGSDFSGFQALPIGSGGSMRLVEAVELLVAGAGGRSTVRVAESDRVSFTLDNSAAEALGYRPSDIAVVVARYSAEADT